MMHTTNVCVITEVYFGLKEQDIPEGLKSRYLQVVFLLKHLLTLS